jgi:hypothetical protein
MTRIGRLLAAAALAAAAFGGTAAAQDADTPVDRALLQVQALIDTLKARPDTDPKVLQRLEEIAGELRKAKEQQKGGAPAAPPGAPPADGGVSDAVFTRTRDSFLRGVELKDEDRARAEEVLREFLADYGLAKNNDDEKSRKVIREHTEKRIARGFPSKEANKMKINLDGIIDFWEGRFGRGGR